MSRASRCLALFPRLVYLKIGVDRSDGKQGDDDDDDNDKNEDDEKSP